MGGYSEHKAAFAERVPDTELSNHPRGEECLELAEAVEADIGNFDDPAHSDSILERISAKIKEHADTLLGGKTKQDFEKKLLEKLVNAKGGGDPAKSEGFGAVDACEFLLKHHGEL